MRCTWQKNPKRSLIGNLNINLLCSKFDQTKCLLKGKIDSLTITFTFTKFFIDGYSKPFRFDRNRNAVGVFLYARKDIVSRELKSDNLPINIDKIFIELNFKNVKWLFLSTYHPPSQSEDYYFSGVRNCLSITHMIDSYWLAFLMLIIPKKVCSVFFRSIMLQTL